MNYLLVSGENLKEKLKRIFDNFDIGDFRFQIC